jgi:hypothetical protein
MENTNFDFDFSFENTENNIVIKENTNYENQILKQIQYVKELTELPKQNEVIRIITTRGVPFVAFIKWINDNEKIKNIYIATYSIGEKVINWITENIGNLGKINLLISKDIKSRHPNTYTRLQDISMDNYKISVKYKHSHVKIYLFKTENNYYIITGSGNANSEASIEQYQIENNKKIFDFYKTLF